MSRAGLESIVRESPLFELSGSLPGASALEWHVRGLQPDLILLELELDDLSRIERSQPPGIASTSIPIVVLVDRPDANWIARALRNGVKAILPQKASPAEIQWSLQSVNLGLTVLESDVTQSLVARFRSESADTRAEFRERLTPREIEILRMLAEGLINKQIASRLAISEHTVKFHISSILDKLGASSRTEAVTIGIRTGLVLL